MRRTRSLRGLIIASALSFVVCLLAHSADATVLTQIVLNPTDVIGSSGAYDSRFVASNILDNQTSPTITESFGTGYWLNPDNGPANAYITIDLGAAHVISQVELFNTANGGDQDRGTGNFEIVGGNAVSAGQLTGPQTVLVSGTLSPATAADASSGIAGQYFNGMSTVEFRYLEFLPTSVAAGSGNPCCGANVYGLNELRVFTPEPSTFILCGLGLVGLLVAARRRKS